MLSSLGKMYKDMFCKKKIFFMCFGFAILCLSILSPLASSEYIRYDQDPDIVYHTGGIIQAKMAMDAGQFPPRTAPWQHNGFGNPWFQIYSPVFYTIGGLFYKFIFTQNPYFVLKFVVWLSLLIGAIYFYRLIFFLTQSTVNASLTATAYVTSPYLLINIFGRGAITEAVAQGFLPIVLYYSFKLFFSEKFNLKLFFLTSLSWFVLIGTHLVTFAYFSLFFALFLILFSVFNKVSIKHILNVGYAYAYALILGCYYLIPIALYAKYFRSTLAGSYNMLTHYMFITPLSNILSMHPTTPMPFPGNGLLTPERLLYVSFGLPILFGVLAAFWLLFTKKTFQHVQSTSSVTYNMHYMLKSLCIVFLFVFFATWSPVNFWPYLPNILQMGQFTYRLFAQGMWIGALLFGIVLFLVKKNSLQWRHGVLGLMLICICIRPWIVSQNFGKSTHVQNIIQNPDIGYGQNTYTIVPEIVGAIKEPFALPAIDSSKNCTKNGKLTTCQITVENDENGIIQLPLFYYPDMINLKINGENFSYFPTNFINYFTLVGVRLSRGKYLIESYFQGVSWANWVSVSAWIIMMLYFCFYFIVKFSRIRRNNI